MGGKALIVNWAGGAKKLIEGFTAQSQSPHGPFGSGDKIEDLFWFVSIVIDCRSQG